MARGIFRPAIRYRDLNEDIIRAGFGIFDKDVEVPVFGEGVIFDAPPDRMKTQLKIQVDALRYQNMKNYAAIIAREVEDQVVEAPLDIRADALDDLGRVDQLDVAPPSAEVVAANVLQRDTPFGTIIIAFKIMQSAKTR